MRGWRGGRALRPTGRFPAPGSALARGAAARLLLAVIFLSAASAGAQAPSSEPRLELQVSGHWMEARPMDGMRLVCRPEDALARSPELPRCFTRRSVFHPPVEVAPSPVTLLVPGRHLWGPMAFRVGAGWDRLELRDTRSPAQPARHHPLSGAGGEVIELPSFLTGGMGATWTACLERSEEGEVQERACFAFGTMPADWGRPMDARIVRWPDAPPGGATVPTAPPEGVSVFHPAEGWVAAQFSATTSWDGVGAVIADGAGLRGDPALPALRMEPEAPEGLVRLRLPGGWTELHLGRMHEDAVGVLGLTAPDPEGLVALHERWSLDPDHGHEVTLRVPVLAGDTWQICTGRGDASRAVSTCYALRFASPNEVTPRSTGAPRTPQPQVPSA